MTDETPTPPPAEAPRVRRVRPPESRIPDDPTLAQIRAHLGEQTWTFAKTMARTPHEYALRAKWVGMDVDFLTTVEYIRAHGERRAFGGKVYLYFDLDGWTYWTMGFALHITKLINRARIQSPAARHPERARRDVDA